MSAGSAAPANQLPWNGHLYYYPHGLQHHYGHPYEPMAHYGNYYISEFAPGPPNTTTLPPTPTVHSDQVQLGQDNQAAVAVVPEQLTPILSITQAAMKAFCDKYDLGDEEHEGLCKLGFQIGDVLDTVTESEWAISGLALLHWRHVLLAWNTKQSV